MTQSRLPKIASSPPKMTHTYTVLAYTWYMFMMGFISIVMPDSRWRTSLSMFIMNRRPSRSRTSFFSLPIVTCDGKTHTSGAAALGRAK